MSVAQRASSSSSSLMVAIPSMMTKEKGGRSSSTHSATRGSRRSAFPLRVVGAGVEDDVADRGAGADRRRVEDEPDGRHMGRPSARTVASLAV